VEGEVTDPPPDIIVEIDVTNESLSKFPTYAALGVPEIWWYKGTQVRMYVLPDLSGRRREPVLPGLNRSSLALPPRLW
jgi:Uma2 family endonuclease